MKSNPMQDRRAPRVSRQLSENELPKPKPQRVYKKRTCWCPSCNARETVVDSAEFAFQGLYCLKCKHQRMMVIRTLTLRV